MLFPRRKFSLQQRSRYLNFWKKLVFIRIRVFSLARHWEMESSHLGINHPQKSSGNPNPEKQQENDRGH